MKIKSLDTQKDELNQAFSTMKAAMSGDVEAATQAEAFAEWCKVLQTTTLAQAEAVQESQTLMGRGLDVLTTAEQKYYDNIITASRSKSPQQALSNVETVMPRTIFDRVFEDLEKSHPILSAIDVVYAGGVAEIYVHKGVKNLAAWGELTGKITEELSADFEKIQITQNKLSAFIPVPVAMLDLGPQWLDRFVRTILGEAIAAGLESGIITGAGSKKNEPIGMMKDLSKPEDQTTGYPDKSPVAVKDFSPETYGGLVAKLCKDDQGNTRTVDGLILVCNPVDYYKKIMPATTVMSATGGYVGNLFPVPTTVITSEYVPDGKAVLGLGKRYALGLGADAGGKLEYSDQYQFLEDNRVYKIKTYANGRAKDNTAFEVLDISALEPAAYTVKGLTSGTGV